MTHAFSDDYIDAENWIDLRVGATGTCFGNLSSLGRGSMMLTFGDWTSLAITLNGLPDAVMDHGETRRQYVGKHVLVRVRRTEDGVEGIAMRPVDGQVWMPLVDDYDRADNAHQQTTVSKP